MNHHFIFILPNIYDHISGVSNKYTSFLSYLSKHNNNNKITLCNVSKNNPNIQNINFHKCSSFTLPFYNTITVPIISQSHLKKNILKDHINIIIFNSEFIWLHNILISLKNKNNSTNVQVKLIPTIHTDIDFYLDKYLPSSISDFIISKDYQLSSFIDSRLTEGTFDKILITGNLLENKYTKLIDTFRVLNVNEIDYNTFQSFYRSVLYRRDYIHKNGAFLNIIFTGRICVEKNIIHNFKLIDFLIKVYLQNDYSKINFHIIGSGPYLHELKDICNKQFQNVLKRTTFHGSQNSNWIGNFYKSIYNPIFLFSSQSETFGKTGVEAMVTGIPLFNIESNISKEIFNKESNFNAFLFKDKMDFIKKIDFYMKMNIEDLKKFDLDMNNFVKKYDQNIIFKKWFDFLTK